MDDITYLFISALTQNWAVEIQDWSRSVLCNGDLIFYNLLSFRGVLFQSVYSFSFQYAVWEQVSSFEDNLAGERFVQEVSNDEKTKF